MEECLGDEKYDNNNLINDEIEVTCIDVIPPDTPPIDMEKGVGLKKMTRMIE